MKLSRKAKRYDESVLPGDFVGFEAVSHGDPDSEGELRYACRRRAGEIDLGDLTLERSAARKQSFAHLKNRAEILSRSLTYLEERLEIVDHDRRGMYIQLRSLPPYKDEAQIRFNEICIARDRIMVKRIAFSRHDEIKQQVPLSLKEELLDRFLADLRQVLDPV